MTRRRVAVAIDIGSGYHYRIDVYAGIQRFAREHAGWDCELDPFAGGGTGRRRTRYDGIIARATGPIAARAARAGVPLVNVWAGSPLADALPTVMADYADCGRMAAEHLLARGYRRFGFQGIRRNATARKAFAGFRGVIERAGGSCGAIAISAGCGETSAGWKRYLAQVDAWIATWEPPLGVFAAQDLYCRFLASACRRHGLRIPEDVGLVTAGNEVLMCEEPDPSLSSIEMGFKRIGFEAAALLERLMAGEQRPPGPVLIEPQGLVLRRSTDLWLVENESVAAALKFIAEHSHEPISVPAVAKHACAAVRSLERHFQAIVGRTIKQEITRLRMERAKRLLVDLDQPVKFVARACGFSTASHFHEVFLRAERMTPRQYRHARLGR